MDRLRILQSELREDSSDVLLDRTFTDEEGLGNGIVRFALRHQCQHVLFTLGEGGNALIAPQLVVEGDLRPARSVRDVTAIEVRRLATAKPADH
jgi:hypothetical protein